MKQLLQHLDSGVSEVADVPTPMAGAGVLLIRTSRSLISAGTERMLVEFSQAGLLSKARQQPDKVRQVLDKVRTDGLATTLEAVRSKLEQPLELGYCNVGKVAQVGEGVEGFSPGDRIVSNGKHAEYVSVTPNLCARIPDNVSDEDATFTVLAAIGLQGVRLLNPTIGECVVVTGLGLIGLLTVQILKAHGCRVLGMDYDSERLELARSYGADVVDLARGEDPRAAAARFSRGRGVDGVLIAASTKSSEPVSQAADFCRKRGRIVLIGVTGLELSRADFYEKELTFQVSCSYGPGRYDPSYEEKGNDYPVGFVRWTEQRNFEAILDLMAAGQIDVSALREVSFPIENAAEAYAALGSKKPPLGIILEYGDAEAANENVAAASVALGEASSGDAKACVGIIGTGNYGGRILLPAFRKAGAKLGTVASARGVSGVHYGKKHGFENATCDTESIFNDDEINAVVIATRHNSHAQLVLRGMETGKNVFVEKPLCLTNEELVLIQAAARKNAGSILMVGFNRRFSPLVVQAKELLDTASGPKCLIMTVNAGDIPKDHWTQDPEVGGGRIVGEGCHFIDLLRHLAGAEVVDFNVASVGGSSAAAVTSDKASISLRFADGSLGAIHYLANGHKAFPKERLEVFCDGKILQIDNFRRLRSWGWSGNSGTRLWRQDKGQDACVAAFVDAVRDGGPSPIPLNEILEVSKISIDAQAALS